MMLVLSRKQGQSIRIADAITVTIVEVGRGRVRIGISAPLEVPVHREELVARANAATARLPQVESLEQALVVAAGAAE